ncbi:GNAT family N-acetyltransferase [Cytobacillus dafuensis]|uniref:GNAT family N-acetyltransferase n=1 Tax=Cytobacillus dafuensis TaxID=1742359 RepID=A0A5B8YZG9_CYTDA|nr:GNAT family N-acetyltransferase [Cytobacillus dafuensis]QED46112.1 GNAT family N-acetyltransferase [Cytobacillus dafuensis]
MEIRKANANDIPELAALMTQLGYPTTIEKMKLRFTHIESSLSYYTLVATIDDKVVGMIGLVIGFYYEMDGSYARIVAFVVDSDYRNKGIGMKLIEEAENWARSTGATGIGLNSGKSQERENAYKFYIKMGYAEKSIGFVKSLI